MDAPPPTPPTIEGGRARLSAGDLRVTVDATAGPRITSLEASAGEELLAVLDPPLTVGPEGGVTCDLHGGHRLWVAPEVPELTYACDDGPARLRATSSTAVLEDDGTPVARRLDVTVADNRVQLDHTVTNTGSTPMVVAPWALTQLRPGGTVCLPVGRVSADEHGLQASGSIVVWPYTRLDDRRIRLEADAVTIDGSVSASGPVKLGVDGSVPWLAYVTRDWVVVIHTAPRDPGGDHADLGAVLQSYVGDRFVELESLGPLEPVAPGGRLCLSETWAVHRRTWAADGPVFPHVEALARAR